MLPKMLPKVAPTQLPTQLQAIIDFGTAITEQQSKLDHARREAAYYKRMLVQALLTNGGTLPIDPSLAHEAATFTKSLEFGNGAVCVEGEVGSLFFVDPLK